MPTKPNTRRSLPIKINFMFPYFFFFIFHFVFGTPLLLTNNVAALKQEPSQPTIDTVSMEKIFARKLFHSLKTGNLSEWMTLYPTDAEYLALLKKMAAKNIDGMTEEKAIALTTKRSKEMAAEGKHDFEQLQAQARKAKLPWRTCAYGDFIFDKKPSAAGEDYLNGDIWLNAGKTEFVIKGVEAVETQHGYGLQNVAVLKRLNNEY